MSELIEHDAEEEGPVMVVFHTWQQECYTKFNTTKKALDWIGECYWKGFLSLGEIIGRDGVVLMDHDALFDYVKEL